MNTPLDDMEKNGDCELLLKTEINHAPQLRNPRVMQTSFQAMFASRQAFRKYGTHPEMKGYDKILLFAKAATGICLISAIHFGRKAQEKKQRLIAQCEPIEDRDKLFKAAGK